MSESTEFDLFVIGAGSGGVRAARIAASLGARVAICEDSRMGGTCVNLGCVPKKLLMYASRYRAETEDARGYGWDLPDPDHSWRDLIHNKDQEIQRLNAIYGRILDRAGCTIIRGRGTVTGPHSVVVGDDTYTARTILIATGGQPLIPPIPGADLGISSDQVFSLPERPQRVAVIGGGYIGIEFASIFRGFGSEVHLIHRGEMLLNPSFDEDIRRFLEEEMSRQGIHLHLGCSVTEITAQADGTRVASLASGGPPVAVDLVLWATGRRPRTKGLGLETAQVSTNARGAIEVDALYQTSAPSIYACGDVIDRLTLTPVALAEGMLIAHNLFGGKPPRTLDYTLVPTAVFSRPNVAMVGLTEQQAREQGRDIDIYRSRFRPMKHTMTGREEKTLMKLIVDRSTDQVLGCHMCGDEAGEIIQGLAVALKAGATKAVFDSTIGIHPTAAEEFVTMRTPV